MYEQSGFKVAELPSNCVGSAPPAIERLRLAKSMSHCVTIRGEADRMNDSLGPHNFTPVR